MSRLVKAIAELLQSPQGSGGKKRRAEPIKRSEFKKLIQQERGPNTLSLSGRSRSLPPRPGPDTEPMNAERPRTERCVY